jgi:thymidylate synthase (FAD)
LNDGFVRLVDSMGGDAAVVQAARVSYGDGTKTVSDDRTLIRYLMRNWHTTPFEMVEFKFHVRVPMDCWRQWIRHRTASVNEYSTRYSEAIDSAQKTTEWRLQSGTNKQGSSDFLTEMPENFNMKYIDALDFTELCNDFEVLDTVLGPCETVGEWLSKAETEFQAAARKLYTTRLRCGVAREQARKDLPLSTYTEAYWKIDLHNLLPLPSAKNGCPCSAGNSGICPGDLSYPRSFHCAAASRITDWMLCIVGTRGCDVRPLLTQEVKTKTLGKRECEEFEVKLARLG